MSRRDMLASAILGFAVGDAYGVPYENVSADRVASLFDHTSLSYAADPVGRCEPGTWSDDTAMTLATIDSLNHTGGRLDPDDMRSRFNRWLDDGEYTPDGKPFGVGHTTRKALRQGFGCSGDMDKGNGSLMRVLPLAFTGCSDSQIRQVSAITHACDECGDCCVDYVHVARRLMGGMRVADALRPSPYAGREPSRSGGYVVETLQAVYGILACTGSYRDVIRVAVQCGGDTDTVSALAGGLAGIVYGGFGLDADGFYFDSSGGVPPVMVSGLRSWDMIERILQSADWADDPSNGEVGR